MCWFFLAISDLVAVTPTHRAGPLCFGSIFYIMCPAQGRSRLWRGFRMRLKKNILCLPARSPLPSAAPHCSFSWQSWSQILLFVCLSIVLPMPYVRGEMKKVGLLIAHCPSRLNNTLLIRGMTALIQMLLKLIAFSISLTSVLGGSCCPRINV